LDGAPDPPPEKAAALTIEPSPWRQRRQSLLLEARLRKLLLISVPGSAKRCDNTRRDALEISVLGFPGAPLLKKVPWKFT
jgi:hypothetical protein